MVVWRPGTITVTDPKEPDVRWRVWRRWYAWRRRITLGSRLIALVDLLNDCDDAFDFAYLVLRLPVVLLGVVVSLIDLIAQLVVLPVVLAARLMGWASWPVQVDRGPRHSFTQRARGFTAAATLRDTLAAQIRDGTVPSHRGAASPSAPRRPVG